MRVQCNNEVRCKLLCFGLIFVGIILRYYHYIMNRSLWVDEAMVALNIISSSFTDLMKPLQHGQLKPIGFLFIENFFVNSFGNSEYALRAFPFICGILSIFIFYDISKKIFNEKVVIISLSLFILGDRLIHYSSETQPYSSDVFISLFLVWIYLRLNESNYSWQDALILLIAGIVSVWISLPAAFILASIGCVWFYQLFIKKEKDSIIYLLLCGMAWFISFVFHYSLLRNNLSQMNPNGVYGWFEGAKTFMPLLPLKPSDVRWYIDTFFNVLADQPTRLFLPGISGFCYIAGLVSLYKKRTEAFLLLLLPVILALIASGFKLYPFYIRWIIFLVPSFILLVSEGLDFFQSIIRPHSKKLAITLLFLFFLQPVACQVHRLMNPFSGEEIKPVLQFVGDNIMEEDQIYIYHSSEPAFKFYCKRFSLCKFPLKIGISGRDDLNKYVEELKILQGKGRIWFVFSHVPDWSDINEEKFFLYILDSIGHRLKESKAHGASVYLYNL